MLCKWNFNIICINAEVMVRIIWIVPEIIAKMSDLIWIDQDMAKFGAIIQTFEKIQNISFTIWMVMCCGTSDNGNIVRRRV